MCVRSEVSPLCLRDLGEIHANTGKTDGLRRRGPGVGGGHFLDGIEVDAASDGCNDEEQGKRSEEHTSELQSHSFISYAVFCFKEKKQQHETITNRTDHSDRTNRIHARST